MMKLTSLVVLLIFIHSVVGLWQLTFSDEFDSQTKVNTTKWNTFYRFSPTVINNELEYYAPDAFKSTTSTLKIIAEKRTVKSSVSPGTFYYTSGALTSLNKFSQTYGYFEMNAKVPTGLGFWPAFWLLPEVSDTDSRDSAQEIDIMEMVMDQPTSVFTTFHCNYSTGGSSGKDTIISNFNTSVFHRFGLQWLPKQLIWYVDGVQVYSINSACVPNRPAYILANLAIGGNWPVPPTSSTPFPSYFEIDYIRAYKYATSGVSIGGPGAGISYTATPDATASIRFLNPTASPEKVTQGSTVTISIVALTDSVAYNNIIISFQFYNSTYNQIGTATVNPISIPTYSSKTITTTFTIPSNVPNGYVSFGFGGWTANWASNFAWENTVGVIGINKVVGQTDHL